MAAPVDVFPAQPGIGVDVAGPLIFAQGLEKLSPPRATAGGDEYEGKPVIGILNTWNELNPCPGHFRERAEAIRRGVWQAGGYPVEIPVMNLSETFMKPTAMYYRNLLAMETEETLRCKSQHLI